MPELGDIGKYVGAFAMACFSGTFLGGMLLSHFWKTFGPWKQLQEAKDALIKCEEHRAESDRVITRMNAEFAEMKVRNTIISEALVRGGFELQIDHIEEVIRRHT